MRFESHPRSKSGGEGAATCAVCGGLAGGRATLTFYGQTIVSGVPICPACYAVVRDKEWIEGRRFDR